MSEQEERFEGCPECGRDTLAVDEEGGTYCANARCRWRM